MSDSISTGPLSDLTMAAKQAAKAAANKSSNNALGEDVFLKLMVTQMKNQNPLDPQKNSEFVAQLAQFSSVEGISKLNTTMNDLVGSYQSSQALQASSLVGRAVKVETDQSYLPQGGMIAGTIELPSSTDSMSMTITDANGQVVSQMPMGPQQAGNLNFAWDGTDQNGVQHPPGMYKFTVQADINGKQQPVTTALSANVNSVSVGANGAISLNVAGVGSVPMSGVKEIL